MVPYWTSDDHLTADGGRATASRLNDHLSQLDVADIDDGLVPFLAAAAAELALLADVAWRFSADDPPVALLRMIAKATMSCPHDGGPHVARLIDMLGPQPTGQSVLG